jgi:hypothetical protein
MKRALIAVGSVGIVAAAVGVEAAHAQYGSPAPPAYTPPPSLQPFSNLCSVSTLYPSRLPSICPSNLQHCYRLHPWLWSAAL